MQTRNKVILGVALACCAVLLISFGAVFGISALYNAVKDSQAAKRARAKPVDAVELLAAFDANPIAAAERYGGHYFEIIGTVDSVGRLVGQHYVDLCVYQGCDRTVSCFAAFGGTFAALERGQAVIARGRVDSSSDRLELQACDVSARTDSEVLPPGPALPLSAEAIAAQRKVKDLEEELAKMKSEQEAGAERAREDAYKKAVADAERQRSRTSAEELARIEESARRRARERARATDRPR